MGISGVGDVVFPTKGQDTAMNKDVHHHCALRPVGTIFPSQISSTTQKIPKTKQTGPKCRHICVLRSKWLNTNRKCCQAHFFLAMQTKFLCFCSSVSVHYNVGPYHRAEEHCCSPGFCDGSCVPHPIPSRHVMTAKQHVFLAFPDSRFLQFQIFSVFNGCQTQFTVLTGFHCWPTQHVGGDF